MSIDELIEDKISNYFETLELLTDNFNWLEKKIPIYLENLIKLYELIEPNLKSIQNLYPDRNIRDTPSPQLYEFILSIHQFILLSTQDFRVSILQIFIEISKDIFGLLTTEDRLVASIDLISTLKIPEIDYKFTRFFYHQILPNWTTVPSSSSSFDKFLSDVQKLTEVIPSLKQILKKETIETLQQDKIPTYLNSMLDSLETLIPIIPVAFEKSMKFFLINYISLIQEYRTVLSTQYEINQLSDLWLSKGLFLSSDMNLNLEIQNQLLEKLITFLQTKKDYSSLGITLENFNQQKKNLSDFLNGHQQLLDIITDLGWIESTAMTLTSLAEKIVGLIDKIKDFPFSKFPNEFQGLIKQIIDSHLSFVEWWRNKVKPSFLHQLQFPGLITEPIQIPWDKDFFKKLNTLASTSLQKFFLTKSKNIIDFIIQFENDLIPVLMEFQNSHKSYLNALGDLRNWEVVRALNVLKNGTEIMDAIGIFFNRWGEGEITNTINELTKVYKTQFSSLYTNIDEIFIMHNKSKSLRFTEPAKALKLLSQSVNRITDSRPVMVQLFPSNPEFDQYLNQRQAQIQGTIHQIKFLDKPTINLVDQMALGWDAVKLKQLANKLKDQTNILESNEQIILNVKIVHNLIHLVETIEIFENFWLEPPIDILLKSDLTKSQFNLFVSILKGLQDLPKILPSNRSTSVQTILSHLQEMHEKLGPQWLSLQNKTNSFLNQQITKIPLTERGVQFQTYLDFVKSRLAFKLSYNWNSYTEIVAKLSKEFFPQFKQIFLRFMEHERNWHKAIKSMLIGKQKMEKIWAGIEKQLEKEIEDLLGIELENFMDKFGSHLRKNLEERMLALRESSQDEAPTARMKGLVIAGFEEFGLN